jgi:hypothetical protein
MAIMAAISLSNSRSGGGGIATADLGSLLLTGSFLLFYITSAAVQLVLLHKQPATYKRYRLVVHLTNRLVRLGMMFVVARQKCDAATGKSVRHIRVTCSSVVQNKRSVQLSTVGAVNSQLLQCRRCVLHHIQQTAAAECASAQKLLEHCPANVPAVAAAEALPCLHADTPTEPFFSVSVICSVACQLLPFRMCACLQEHIDS